MSDQTPMMQQYKSIKQDQQDAILFFRLGDFYEMFFDDAKEASQILNLVLTARNGTPMCGIPYHASKVYIKRLIDAGRKVAICEQTEAPQKGKGLVNREVTEIVTAGTVIDDDFLDASRHNYIFSIASHDGSSSCSFADLSTGDFTITDISPDPDFDGLRSLIQKIQPAELLIQESLYYEDRRFRMVMDQCDAMITKYPDWFFSIDDSHTMLTAHFKTSSLKQFGISSNDPALLSAGVLFSYFTQNSRAQLGQIQQISRYDASQYVQIDESAQKNLELLRNLHDGSEKHTLFSVLRHTRCAAGTRLLRDWIVHPLADLQQIMTRQHEVQRFYQDQRLLDDTRDHLSRVLDLQRLTTRVIMHRSIPWDLLAISQTIESVQGLLNKHPGLYDTHFFQVDQSLLQEALGLSSSIIDAIEPECKGAFEEGRVIRDGFDSELDRLRLIKHDGQHMLQDYLDEIKKETGITSIRLKSNKIIGHFFEVTKSQAHLVPDTFLRKQTLVQGERYTTERLIEMERSIFEARGRSEELERALYEQVIEQVRQARALLLRLSDTVAVMDCYQSFAYCAIKRGYIRPEVVEEDVLTIEQGRHPVVESIMDHGVFVPNSLHMHSERDRSALITGPNMSGKSTYLRQTALIVLLAHIGSFVPADAASIGRTDKIFCRVGASDNLVRGESTFLVEMNETAYILRSATSRSLVIMDEVGRGTSTRDGLSIAFAVLSKLLVMRPKTLFATHYHELTKIEHEQLQKLYLDIADEQGSIIFLNRVRAGVVSSSYGLHAAELAGIPSDVLNAARAYQQQHAADDSQPQLFYVSEAEKPAVEEDEIITMLRRKQIDHMTPLEALLLLKELQDRLHERT
jgi:DNA mismatch repair protein MutS